MYTKFRFVFSAIVLSLGMFAAPSYSTALASNFQIFHTTNLLGEVDPCG